MPGGGSASLQLPSNLWPGNWNKQSVKTQLAEGGGRVCQLEGGILVFNIVGGFIHFLSQTMHIGARFLFTDIGNNHFL